MATYYPTNTVPPNHHRHRARRGFIPLSRLDAPVVHTAGGKRRARGVSFAPTVRVKTVDKLSSTPEEKSRLYHSKEEMNGFYRQVKDFYSAHPDRPGASPSRGASSPTCVSQQHQAQAHVQKRRECLVRIDADPALRGLEAFFYPVRPKNKSLARRALLKHYADLNRPDCELSEEEKVQSLAATSCKLSYWSRLVAAETARLDVLRAYPPVQHRAVCTAEAADDDDGSLPIKKRTVSFDDEDSDDDSQPAKRRRM